MAAVRILSCFPHSRRKTKQIALSNPLRLMFGCGETRYSGWIAIDGLGGKHVDIQLDLRRRLPFGNDSVDLCFSEHFLEHLSPDEGLLHLQEVYRVLRPGGRYRVVVPDARRFVEKYLEHDLNFFEKAFPWADSPIDAVYHIVNWNGAHRNIFDLDRLVVLARKAGFDEVISSSAHGSDLPELRIDVSSPQRNAESLYAELIKAPPA